MYCFLNNVQLIIMYMFIKLYQVRIKNYDKNDEDTKSVSIWLKRKTYKNETEYSFYYIWVLEEVKDKVVDIEIDNEVIFIVHLL